MRQEMQGEAQQLFSEATEDIAERDKRRAVRAEQEATAPVVNRQRASLSGLVVGVPVLAVILVINLTDWSLTSLLEPRPSTPAARKEAQDTLDALVHEIESFREDYKELPEELVEIGVPARGNWTYARTGSGHFTVRGTLYGQSVTFDSATSNVDRVREHGPVANEP